VTSIRYDIQKALVARLATITGWDVQLRGMTNTAVGDATVRAVVWTPGENKRIANTDKYSANLQVGVDIACAVDAADAVLDEGNPLSLLDRMIVLAEKKVHAPDAWGLDPEFNEVTIDGHDIREIVAEDGHVRARLRLTFVYRHDYLDPEAG